MPLDPQVKLFLEKQAAVTGPLPTTPVERREARRVQGMMTVVERQIPGPVTPISVRIYSPPGPRPLPVLVYYHGGGWVTGDLDTHDFQCRLIARWAECLVVHVNYRHAPEHPFPAATDDAYAGLCWVAANAGELEADASRIAVGGDSAGGNIAAAVTIMARDQGGPSIVFQYLGYPVTDGAMALPSYKDNSAGYGLTYDAMAWYWDQYVPNREDRSNPLASPLSADNLKGLPPALVMTAEYDPLRDEGEQYAARLKEAGVPAELKRYDGMVHGFLGQTAEVDAAKGAVTDLAAALRKAFAQEA